MTWGNSFQNPIDPSLTFLISKTILSKPVFRALTISLTGLTNLAGNASTGMESELRFSENTMSSDFEIDLLDNVDSAASKDLLAVISVHSQCRPTPELRFLHHRIPEPGN